jgi:uncharacterized repeat protein (TIGR01451 family)
MNPIADLHPPERQTTRDRAIALFMTTVLMASAMLTMAPTVAASHQSAECGIRPIDLVLIMDRSGSMNTLEGAQTRLAWAKQAANGLVNELNGHGGVGGAGLHLVGVSSFAGTSASTNVALSAAADAATVTGAVNALVGNGGTPLDVGMANGASNMTGGDRGTHAGADVTQVTILLSDGNPDPDSYTPNDAEKAAYLASADRVYAVAIGPDSGGGGLGGGGTGVDHTLLTSIASPGLFRAVTSGSGLPSLFAEIYEELACPTGKLEVVKHLNPTNDAGRFDLWINQDLLANEAGHGGSTGEQTLIAGMHTVAETADGETSLGNYASSISCVDQANQNAAVAATQGQGASWSVDVTGDSDIKCTIANARKTGTLTVIKAVTNDDGGAASCDDFSFSVSGGPATPFDGADCTNVLTLATGTYSVTEPAAAGYTTSYANCSQMAVVHGGNVTCTITNDDQPASLIVIKDLTTDDGSDASCADFSFRVNGGTAVDFDDDCRNDLVVDAGTYSIVETDAGGFATGYANCSGLQIPNGGSATCTVSNDDKPGTLIVKKVVSGGNATCDDFSFRVNGGTAMDFEGDCSNSLIVPAGSYSVTESAAPGYTTTYANCSQVGIANGGSATCTITNTRQTGSLEVIKQLAPGNDPGLFDLLVDGSVRAEDAGDGDSTGSLTVNTGSHAVREMAGTGTSLTDYSSSIECFANGGEGSVIASAAGTGPLNVNVTHGADVLCVITNTRVSVSIDKVSDQGDNAPVLPGQEIHYTLEVTVNAGQATNVVVTDELPAGLSYVAGSADPSSGFSVDGQELTWTVGTLAKGTHSFEYDATVDADARGSLANLGCVDAEQNDDLVCDTTTARVQRVSVEKTNGSPVAVVPGGVVDFALAIAVSNGPVESLTLVDQLPDGLGNVTDISDGGSYDAETNRISWNLSDVADGRTLTYRATIDASATAGSYTNVVTITDGPCTGASCEDDSTVVVRTPTLVVDKVADTETITISGPNDDLLATPSIVTWTISWTLTDGPVTNAVITDELPAGLVFLDASDGGVLSGDTVTWTFPTLTTSGSVTVRTTVDPETISRVAPTANVAVIDSDETGPDQGEDSVTVSVEPPPQGGNPTPTPKPMLPDTAVEHGPAGQSSSVPLALLAAMFLGALALMTLRARRSR